MEMQLIGWRLYLKNESVTDIFKGVSLGKSENISSKAHCRILSVFTLQTVQPLLFTELSQSLGKTIVMY